MRWNFQFKISVIFTSAFCLLTMLATHAALGQCTATVSGQHSIEFSRASLPPEALPLLLLEQTVNPNCNDWGVDLVGASATVDYDGGGVRVNWTSSHELLGKAGDLLVQCILDPSNCGLAPSYTPCSWDASKPIVSFSGASDIYAVDVGVDGPWTVNKDVTITMCNSFEIYSPVANTVEQSVGLSGIITAAESLGDMNVTKAKGSLTMSGSCAGQSLGEMTVEVESISLIPETGEINETKTIAIELQPGNNTIDVNVTATMVGEVVAKSTGLYGMIAGAATLAIAFPNTITIGNITGVGGGELPSGVVVTSLVDGLVYNYGPNVTSVDSFLQPSIVSLRPAVPNPLTSQTLGSFELREPRDVSIRIYDARGRLVQTLLDHVPRSPGSHDWSWDGRDSGGRRLPAGVYFFRLELPDEVLSRKLVLLR